MKVIFLSSVLLALAAGALSSRAADAAPPPISVNDAAQIARSAVKPELQTKVVSVYGIGTPDAIQRWYIIFYDPSVPSHGRAVLVEGQKIAKTYPANGGVTYDKALTFDPARITSEQPALHSAQVYAARHHLAYNAVRALLRETSLSKPFRWRVELLRDGESLGFVYVNALDAKVADYAGPPNPKASDGSTGNFTDDVKNTFLHIGGDLEEFFTGDRTVDKPADAPNK